MANALQKIVIHAERLYELRKAIEEIKEAGKRALEPMEVEREAMEQVLISELNKNGLASIKVKSGETFTKEIRKGVEIVNDAMALKWAVENMAVTVDKRLVKQKLKDIADVPMGFRLVEGESIRVTKPKEAVKKTE